MAENYESFYGGGVSSLSPEYGNFVGYRMSASALGFPGSPQTANQLGETVNALKQGVKAFEVSMVMPETTEVIPKQHFEEMRALMKLSGVKPSVHGPVIDASGFTDKGWGGDDGRADNERRMFDAIEKSHVLDPKGNIPIVFHSSNGAPGAEWRPGKKEWGEDEFVMEKGAAINRETGQAIPIKREYKFRPGHPELFEKGGEYVRDERGRVKVDAKGKPIIKYYEGRPPGLLFDAEGSIDSINLGEWENKLTEVAQMNKHAEEIIGSAALNLPEYENAGIIDGEVVNYKTGETLPPFDKETGQDASYDQIRKAGLFLENAELTFKGAFHNAYKYGTPEQKKELKKLSQDYADKMEATSEILRTRDGKKVLNIWGPVKRQKLLDEYVGKLRKITSPDYGGETPKLYQESTTFAMDKASETFGNLAMKSYERFGKSAPVIAVENMFQGFAFSRAEDLKPLVEKSRERFVEQLVKKEGMSKKEAKRVAEKQLGVTWDVGHLNVMKKKGFTDEDILKQTKLISKDKSMVKHVHLTDNFGFADSHLAPGMGNVPLKGILEELEKTGKLGEMRKIVEAGAFVQHFKKSPHPWTMAALGSPIYGMKNAPYWNQVMDVQGSYFGGYGTVNPPTHHQYFGAGFTTMPVELGGQMPGGQSRFGGTPMA
jgi:sugar phosphate isomerase/epimerase